MKNLTVKYEKAGNGETAIITKEIEESQLEAYIHSYRKVIIASYEKFLGYSFSYNDANLGSEEWREIEKRNDRINYLISTIKFELV